MPEPSYAVRQGGPDDVEAICAQRRAMYVDMGQEDAAALDEMTARFRPWVAQRLSDGTYLAWLIETNGRTVAGAGVWMKPVLPGLRGTRPEVPYVLNVYRAPDHRRRGLARLLMDAIVTWAKDHGHRGVELHASDEGRPLYDSMGFLATNEMRLTLG